jgi:glycosyltransferase involved in cell wall biosynthesis
LKVLFVHEVSWRKKVVYEIHDFPELMALGGHDISFLEYDEEEGLLSAGSVQLTNNFLQSTSTMSRAHRNSNVRVITPKRLLPGTGGRLLAVVLHPIAIWIEIKKNRPDLVVLYGIPTNGWQTVLICRHFEIPILLRAIDVSHQLRNTVFLRMIKSAEKFVYRNVDHISANNTALAAYINQLTRTNSPISVLLPGVDLEKFKPAAKPNELKKRYGIEEHDKVILFMGTLFRFSGLSEFLLSASEHLQSNPHLKVLIIGDGEDRSRLELSIRELGLEDKVILTGRIEYDELASHLHLGDVAVLPFLQLEVAEYAFPGKVLQYLSAGLPTVSVHLQGLESTFPPDSGFVFVSNTDEMIEKCIEILNDDELRVSLKKLGRERMEEMCNWDIQVNELLTVMKTLI